MKRLRGVKRQRFVGGDSGAALVEFAIVLPLLFMIVFGIIDFARAFYTQNNLTSAVREGARWASVQPIGNLATAAGVQGIVKGFANKSTTEAKFGGPAVGEAGGGIITLTKTPATNNPEFITVDVVDYPFEWWTPLPGMVGFGNITLSASAKFRWERHQ